MTFIYHELVRVLIGQIVADEVKVVKDVKVTLDTHVSHILYTLYFILVLCGGPERLMRTRTRSRSAGVVLHSERRSFDRTTIVSTSPFPNN